LDITWYGHSCFRITERGQIAVITDPYYDEIGLPVQKLRGDVVTVSHDAPGHNAVETVKGMSYALSRAGEYEIGGVFFSGIAMHHVNEDNNVHHNIAYTIQMGGLTVLHLGDLAHVPPQSTIEAMGEVHAVLVPVGGGRSLNASMAAEVIALIEPSYIIPMHYMLPGLTVLLDPLEKFLKEMGVSKVQEEESLRITVSGLPEQPQVVVMVPNIKE
jgi:L-ascorbate metabolism protein UlaG (beta-lactamase superfamily)